MARCVTSHCGRGEMSKKKEPRNMEALAGRWKVIDVQAVCGEDSVRSSSSRRTAEETGGSELRGVELLVDESGEATWFVPATAPEGVELFDTTSCYQNKDGLVFFMGGKQGQSLTFHMDGTPSESGRFQLVSEDGNLSLALVKERSESEMVDDYFSLRVAMDEAFFSDLTFSSSDGASLPAHQVVLEAAYPAMAVADWQRLFLSQPACLGRMLLGCVYSDCLPERLTVSQARELKACLLVQPKLARLQQLCTAFIEANDLKQKLIQLIDELLHLLEEAKRMVSITDMSDSVKIKYAIKHLSKDAAVGGAKLGLLCELYTRNKKEMSKSDKREVLDYLRARVVVFNDLLRELIVLSIQKWEALEHEEQLEVAQDLIPEVEQVWDFLLKLAMDIQSSLHEHPSLSKRVEQKRAGVSMALNLISRGSELKRLKKIRREFHESVEIAQRKRERWDGYSDDEKADQVLDVVGKLVNEGTDMAESMESRKNHLLMENGLEWKRFRSYVDLYCTYITWGLHKILSLKETLKPLLFKPLKFIQRSEVTEVLLFLDVLSQAELSEIMEDEEGERGRESSCLKLPKQLSRLSGLEPPRAANSVLACGCLNLVGCHQHADMEFVLGEAPKDGMEKRDGEREGEEEGVKHVVIPAHRVIVASRCEWARRALQSGMREARERRIAIPDVEEDVFRLFLNYLYGGHLDASHLPTDTLAELMAVADRFETPLLLGMCEELLVDRVKDSTVFHLLAVADHYNAQRLREATLKYVLSQPEVIMREVDGYSNLSESLRQELRQLLSGMQDPTLALRHRPQHRRDGSQQLSVQHTGSVSSESVASSECEDEEYQLDPDTLQFQEALQQLRGIVGPDVSQIMLQDLLLAADMDINKAVNYYFNTQDTGPN